MKTVIRFVTVVIASGGFLMAATALAHNGRGGGGHGGGFGGGHGGYGRYWGGYGWCGAWGGGPWFVYDYGWPYYYYPDPPTYYCAPAPVVYSSPTVNYGPQQPALAPANYSAQVPAPTATPNVQHPSAASSVHPQSVTVAEIKALAKGGLSDAVILGQIRNNQAVFHLTADEIVDLKNSGVSERVIEYMINTLSQP